MAVLIETKQTCVLHINGLFIQRTKAKYIQWGSYLRKIITVGGLLIPLWADNTVRHEIRAVNVCIYREPQQTFDLPSAQA